uniref:protein acetyllysine N-acetyltransferase n=1 Tax=Arcella intermedia TaxID=1963864 RepID=A0A6B2L9C5_9EUKA|eukprot:TRINITY_DN459_c0_g1_i1.p1 TRINITY_DN459_c0_g1~~TRINITY_DN459_c0_g1_i1.p1  ORF type:complete len:333 (+),score=29.03 TRINITY_DN459_c0_g1_i1:59-1057(+)
MAHTALNDEEIEEFYDSPEELEQKVTQLADLIKRSRYFVVYTGAGISTSAGISDFRGPDGVWTRKAKGLEIKRGNWGNAQPTICHMTLVALVKMGKLKCVVSQNCDGLHIKSGIPPNKICELHGNTNVEACSLCGEVYYRGFPVRQAHNPACTTERFCEKCKNIPLRFTTVAFGQSMPDMCLQKAEDHATEADLSLCIGTSMRVQPACNLPLLGHGNPGFNLVIINLQKTPYDSECSVRIFAKIDEVMLLLTKKLDIEIPHWEDLRLHEDEKWMDLFKKNYQFRSAGSKDWFQGAHDGVDLKINCTRCAVLLKYPQGAKIIQCPKCFTKIQL